MIDIKLKQLLDSEAELVELKGLHLKGQSLYNASSIFRLAKEELTKFGDLRNAICLRYEGKTNPEGNAYQFPTVEASVKANNEILELLNATVQLQASKISFEGLEVADPTVGLISNLNWCINPPVQEPQV